MKRTGFNGVRNILTSKSWRRVVPGSIFAASVSKVETELRALRETNTVEIQSGANRGAIRFVCRRRRRITNHEMSEIGKR